MLLKSSEFSNQKRKARRDRKSYIDCVRPRGDLIVNLIVYQRRTLLLRSIPKLVLVPPVPEDGEVFDVVGPQVRLSAFTKNHRKSTNYIIKNHTLQQERRRCIQL